MARFPWWAGMVLALLSYLILHWAYQQFGHHLVVPVPQVAGSLSAALMPKMRESLGFAATGVAQYVLPLVFLLGALGGAIRRHQARSLVAQAQDELVRIQGMSWQQFERLLAQVFREQGYRVQETGGGGADGGIDLILSRDGQRTLVQCKHWKTRQVGVTVVREMYGLLVAHGAKRVKVVTSGDFSAEARRFAHGKPIDLVGCAELARWFGHFVDDKTAEAVLSSPDPSLADPIPLCPRCGQFMRRRQAKTGPSAGQSFWGCSQFPHCCGTRAC
ncbi:MAG: restriction endonuclease [Acidiferrobacter sp.]